MDIPTSHSQPPPPPVKVLVVDDREDNLFSIESVLEQDGYEIIKANSGRAALKVLLKEHDFALILMDVQMPGLNGFETASMIYERDKLRHIPIIFITAHDQGDENIFRGYQSGGVDYLYKPINPDLLRAKVGVFVELHRKTQALLAQEQKLTAANKELEREIQERKNSEAQISVLNRQLLDNIHKLELSNEELERFAYVASHDLQEPLRKIIIFGDRLSAQYRENLGPEGTDFLDRMLKASGRMKMLIHNLLAFSRSSSTEDVFEMTDLNQVMADVLSDLEVEISRKNAVIRVSKLPTLPAIPSLLHQLLQNLVANALKFSRNDRTPEIRVFSAMVPATEVSQELNGSGQQFCSISISDNGIGFEQEYADQIFMIFKRLHNFDQFEGTGIGLSICKKIAERHKGYIAAYGEPGAGATFTISLPAPAGEKQAYEPLHSRHNNASERH